MLTRSAPPSPASNFSLCSRRLNWCSVSPNRRATQRGGLPGLLHTVSAISATNAPRVQCHSRLTNYTTRPIVVSVRRRGSFVNSMPEAPMALRRSVPDRVRQGGRHWDRREIGGATAVGYVRVRSLTEGGCVAWVLRLVEIGAEGEERCAEVMEISRPDSLDDIADLGLTLADARLVLAGVQREIVAAQARVHAVHRPACRGCGAACRMKDYRQHAIATLFGQVTVRLPRFRCAGCGTTEASVAWPPYTRSTPELG